MRDTFDAWQKSSHHAFATCNDCHVPDDFLGRYASKAVNGYRHGRAFTFMDFHEPIRIRPYNIRIVNENCRRCHAALVAELPHNAADGGASSCTSCHVGVGHGPAR
jgi:cytochrome c nitrite reductase small subunit